MELPKEKVRVRVLIAVTPEGKFLATGYSDAKDEDLVLEAIDGLESSIMTHWINLDLPIEE